MTHIHFLTKAHSMFDGIIGKISGCTIPTIENVPSIAKKLKNRVANHLQTHSLLSHIPEDNRTWGKEYPDIARMCKTDKNLLPDIALLFEDGTKTNHSYLTNDTLLIEVTNGDKKAFITLDKANEEFATTHRWNDGKDDKLTIKCDGAKYDINLPFSSDNITLKDISRRTRVVSRCLNDLEIISTKSTKKKQ